MTVYPADIINRALNLAGCEITIGDPQDGSRESQIALRQYTQTVWALLRASDHEFSRKAATLALSGNGAQFGWDFEYVYPADCLKVRMVVPNNGALNSPIPTRWDVGANVIGGVMATVIWTNTASASLVYTTSGVTEDFWNPLFTETVVQYLSASLAPLLSSKDEHGQSKGGPDGYATALKIAGIDVGKDS